MGKRKKGVTVKVDNGFFDTVFEPERQKLQKQLGLTNLTQRKFTSMIKTLRPEVDLSKLGAANVKKFNKR